MFAFLRTRKVALLCLVGLAGCVSPRDRVVGVRAKVLSYSPNAAWDHYEDGGFAAWDVAVLEILSPPARLGEKLSLLCSEQPVNSPLRAVGVTYDFGIQEKYLVGEYPGTEEGTSVRYVPGPAALRDVRKVESSRP